MGSGVVILWEAAKCNSARVGSQENKDKRETINFFAILIQLRINSNINCILTACNTDPKVSGVAQLVLIVKVSKLLKPQTKEKSPVQ